MEQALRRQVINLQKTLHNLTYNYTLLQEQQEHLINRLNTDEEIRDKTFRQVNIRDLTSEMVTGWLREFLESLTPEEKGADDYESTINVRIRENLLERARQFILEKNKLQPISVHFLVC